MPPCDDSATPPGHQTPAIAARPGRQRAAPSRTRASVRDLKRAVHAGTRPGADDARHRLAREGALALLGRSIAFGHRRLAVIRYALAVDAGAAVPPAQRDYCRAAAGACRDPRVMRVFLDAAAQDAQRPREAAAALRAPASAGRPAT